MVTGYEKYYPYLKKAAKTGLAAAIQMAIFNFNSGARLRYCFAKQWWRRRSFARKNCAASFGSDSFRTSK